MKCVLFAKMDQVSSLGRKKTTTNTGKNTERVGEFCQSGEVETMLNCNNL